jgi:hypothetical protein
VHVWVVVRACGGGHVHIRGQPCTRAGNGSPCCGGQSQWWRQHAYMCGLHLCRFQVWDTGYNDIYILKKYRSNEHVEINRSVANMMHSNNGRLVLVATVLSQ